MVHRSDPARDVSFASQISRVRRYWWLVLAVTALCASVGFWNWSATSTSYTARSSLIMASDDRSPDQDAVLVQGFAAYLNSPSYEAKLAEEAALPPGTTVTASTSAGSPILLIDVTADSPGPARIGATRVARVFSRDMNRGAEDRQAALENLLQQLSAEIAKGGTGDAGDRSQEALTALSQNIGELRAPRSNVLDVLQLEGGLTEMPPSPLRTVGLGLVGGAVAGVLLALLVGRLSGRLGSSEDLPALGLAPLSEDALDPDAPAYDSQVRGIATVAGTRVKRPGSLAVAATGENGAAAALAESIAGEWARSGRTVLAVLPEPPRQPDGSLTEEDTDVPRALQKLAARIVRGPIDRLWLLTPDRRQGDETSLVTLAVQAVEAVRSDSAAPVDSVVVAATGLGVSGEAEAVAVVSECVLVVVEPGGAGLRPTSRALERLRNHGVKLLGAVVAAREHRDETAGGSHRLRVRRP